MLAHVMNLGSDGKICVVGLHRKRCRPQHQPLTRAARSTAGRQTPRAYPFGETQRATALDRHRRWHLRMPSEHPLDLRAVCRLVRFPKSDAVPETSARARDSQGARPPIQWFSAAQSGNLFRCVLPIASTTGRAFSNTCRPPQHGRY